MIWNYETLHTHFAKVHAEVLKEFELGWNSLPYRIQKLFLKDGFKSLSDENDRPLIFTNWTKYMHDKISVTGYDFHRKNKDTFLYACDALFNSLEHEGSLYGLPPLPESSLFNRTEDGKNDYLFRLKGQIVGNAVSRYLDNEEIVSLCKLEEDVYKNGHTALLSYFKNNKMEWPPYHQDNEDEDKEEEVTTTM